jgi:hypothetical protein
MLKHPATTKRLTMKPIYFPFTFISKPIVEALSACFKQTAVYQVSSQKVPEKMQEWCESGTLDIRIPVEGDEKKLDKILKDYRAWINLHQGSEIDFLKTQADKIPIFDETSSSKIRDDIKKKIREEKPQEKPDDLFNAILFLHIAQEFDLQKVELKQDLLLFETMEQNLMKNLKGENEDVYIKTDGDRALEADDPGHYMTKERLMAWTRLMQHDQQDSELLVTSSRAMLEYMIDIAPEMEKLICFDTIPLFENSVEEMESWQIGLMESLDMLVKNPWPSSTDGFFDAPATEGYDRKVALTLYIVPGVTPNDFFVRCIEGDQLCAKDESQKTGPKNTLIGLFETL